MRLLGRLFRLVWGGDVDRALRPVLAVSLIGSLGGAADQAMVADLVAPERHEAAYASVRVASNLGVTIGPPIGGLLLIGRHWNHLWIGVLPLAALAFAIAYRYIPRGGAYAPA